MATPSSVRFDPDVLERLSSFVEQHPGLSLSSASNLLVDEALRSAAHPLVVFSDGPTGRRARLIGGPDLDEVIGAVHSVRNAEPNLSSDDVLVLVEETSGVQMSLIRAAIEYWAEFPDEIEARIGRNKAAAAESRIRWQRANDLLG
jgi:hypothetical protein